MRNLEVFKTALNREIREKCFALTFFGACIGPTCKMAKIFNVKPLELGKTTENAIWNKPFCTDVLPIFSRTVHILNPTLVTKALSELEIFAHHSNYYANTRLWTRKYLLWSAIRQFKRLRENTTPKFLGIANLRNGQDGGVTVVTCLNWKFWIIALFNDIWEILFNILHCW